MSERISLSAAADQLRAADRIVILTHQFPDGDTLGSAFALCRALHALGKQARVLCSDPLPEKYDYMWKNLPAQEFEPAFVCAVDVADAALLGEGLSAFANRVELCIDHHASHRDYEQFLVLNAAYAATAMIMVELLDALGVAIDTAIADCLFTGISTDTGCFKYSNVTPLTHRMAARLMECGAHAEAINRAMFDIKSRARLSLEQKALSAISYYYKERVAVMLITEEMMKQSGAAEDDMEGLSPLPRQIEGVWVGFTIRQKADGNYKVSARTGTHADASVICGLLGGGGHARAAGCTLSGTVDEIVDCLLDATARAVPRITE
ncbi:MAG: DHH family phosphoesterase [Clostridia bacterium]|nr:DHH family phosphoesterase [Clostridia bacterium]